MPYKKPKRRPQKGREPETLSKKGRRVILSATLAIATLLGYVVLIPSMAVVVSDPVDTNDPFSSTVTITNTGFLTLDSVEYSIALSAIHLANGHSFASGSEYAGVLVPDSATPQHLESDQQFSFPLNDVFTADKASLADADIGVLVTYWIPIVHWKRQRLFPMAARRQSNGNFYWYAKAPPQNVDQMRYYRISRPLHIPAVPKPN